MGHGWMLWVRVGQCVMEGVENWRVAGCVVGTGSVAELNTESRVWWSCNMNK